MKLPALYVAVAVSAALLLSACSSDDEGGTSAATTTAAVGRADLPLPTAADVNARISQAFDPAVPVGEKLDLIEGIRTDATLVEQLSATAAGRSASLTIADPIVAAGPGQFTAPFTASIDGAAIPGEATFVVEDGVWKLSKANGCALITGLGLVTDQCAA